MPPYLSQNPIPGDLPVELTAIIRTPAYRSRDEEAKALMMKQVLFKDGFSACSLNMAHPNFFVGVRTFSKGDSDKKVYTPVPLVENAFASDEARKSYGFVPEDAPFMVTVTRT